jgi:hypothetical protein
MTPEDMKFYRDFYKVMSNPEVEQLFVRYAQILYNKALAKIRTEQEPYSYGYCNGQLDAWDTILTLKTTLTKIMQNIG